MFSCAKKDEGNEASPAESAGTKYSTGKPRLCSQTVATHERVITWSTAQVPGHLRLPGRGLTHALPSGHSLLPEVSGPASAPLRPPSMRTPAARSHGRLCRLQKARSKPLLALGQDGPWDRTGSRDSPAKQCEHQVPFGGEIHHRWS